MEIPETARLIFRPLSINDAEDLHRLYGNALCMRYITGRPRTRSETQARLQAHIEQHDTCGFGLCAAIHRKNNQFIGRCGIEPRVETTGLAGDLAWMFLPEYWGNKLGRESGQAFLDFGLSTMNLYRVYATADHRNLASIAIMNHLGMQFVKENDRGVEYEIRQTDWAARRQ